MHVKRKQNNFENPKPKKKLKPMDLKNAILNGNYQRVEQLLQNCRFSHQELDKEHFIHMAVENRHLDIAEKLLQKGANPNVQDENYSRHYFPIHVATRNGDTAMLEVLLKYGAIIDPEDRKRQKPIHLASIKGHLNAAKFLIDNGSNINVKDYSGKTPMHYASFLGHIELVRMYIQYGGQIEARAAYLNTPLLTSVTHSTHNKTILFLIKSGANVHAQNSKGMSPLHIASINNKTEVVSALISKGAKTSTQDNQGNTPLNIAVMQSHEETVEIILAAMSKTDLTIRNKKGLCAIDIAINKRSLSIARMITKKLVDSSRITDPIYPLNKLIYHKHFIFAESNDQ